MKQATKGRSSSGRKMKSRKSVVRRIKITGTGKLIRRRGFARHLKATKRKSRIRRLSRPVTISGSFEKKLRKVLGLS